MNKSIIEKIKKLMAMTEARGATPDEAANAAAKVSELLFAYNLSQADLKETPEDDITMTLHGVIGAVVSRRSRHLLMHIITEFNFCESIADEFNHRHMIIGKPHNVQICIYMCEAIGNAIHSMANEALRQTDRAHGRAFYHAFWSGACHTIRERLAEQRANDQAASASSNTLVVQSSEDLAAAKERMMGKNSTRNMTHRSSHRGGYHAGREAGYSVPLSKGLSTTNRRGYLP